MRAMFLPDLHTTETTPKNRKDNYAEAVWNKLLFIFETAIYKDKNTKPVDLILQPGDFTDSYSLSWRFFIKLVELIESNGIPIITIHGQHSLKYRNAGDTVLDALEQSCGSLRIINSTDVVPFLGCDIYGSSYGDVIPEVVDKKKTNILVIHKMIVQDQKLWPGQEDYVNGKAFLRLHDFNIVVSGDNHQTFICESGKKKLFNMGSMMRSTVSQIGYRPSIAIYDTDTGDYKLIELPIDPDEEVFKMEKIQREKEVDDKLDAFVQGLSENREMALSFRDNLRAYASQQKLDPVILKIIEEAQGG